MSSKPNLRKVVITAASICVAAMMGLCFLAFHDGVFQGTEIVDEQGNVVGEEYLTWSTAHGDRFRQAAQRLTEGDNEGAEQIYSELVELDSHNPDAYIGLASAQLRQSSLVKARRNYAMALELDRSNTAALYGAGAVESMAGNSQQAKTYYQKVLSSDPDHRLSHYGMAKACDALGEEQRAKKHAKRFLELASGSALCGEMSEILERR